MGASSGVIARIGFNRPKPVSSLFCLFFARLKPDFTRTLFWIYLLTKKIWVPIIQWIMLFFFYVFYNFCIIGCVFSSPATFCVAALKMYYTYKLIEMKSFHRNWMERLERPSVSLNRSIRSNRVALDSTKWRRAVENGNAAAVINCNYQSICFNSHA